MAWPADAWLAAHALNLERFAATTARPWLWDWGLPLIIILIVPMCLLCGILGVWLRGMDNNIITQIGFVVLVGLACKNAVLIVEFAKQQEEHGLEPVPAAIEACRLRLRPILMTSFGLFLTPVFYVTVRAITRRWRKVSTETAAIAVQPS